MNETGSSTNLKLFNDSLKKVIAKEVKLKDFNERLVNTRQEKVIVKEILLESEVDLVQSLKQLKKVFQDELKSVVEKVNDLYNSELLKLQQLYKTEAVGNRLIDIVKTISKSGWYLLMKDNSVNAYKYYSPPFEVIEGYCKNGVIKQYEEPVCLLRSIYVNILHPIVTIGTIHISSEGHHPNVDTKNFGVACVGTFEGRDIPLDDSQKLLELLNEISACYESVHLESCYYTPTINSTTRKDTDQWKAA
jgi:hypothetical protein